MEEELQIRILENVVNRIDTSIEKLTEVSNNISKLLAVHDQRLNTLEKSYSRQEDDIREVYSKVAVLSKDICSKLDELENVLENRINHQSSILEKQHKNIQLEFSNKLEQVDKRIQILETWRWFVLGAAAVVGYIINKFIN